MDKCKPRRLHCLAYLCYRFDGCCVVFDFGQEYTGFEQNRTDRKRPHVVLSPDIDIPFKKIKLANVGLTAAYDVAIESSPNFCFAFSNHKDKPIVFLNNTLSSLAPGITVSCILGNDTQLEAINPQKIYKGIIRYKDILGNKFKENFIVDYAIYDDTTYSGKKNIHHVAEELFKIGNKLDRLLQDSKR